MIVLEQPEALRSWRKARTGSLGLVPTMGSLHAGHEALVQASLQQNDHTVVSIFVNPLQFNETQDFDSYPRPLQEDEDRLRRLGTSVLYRPKPAAMYPEGFETTVQAGPGGGGFEGEFRPGHFDGMLTVVLKLLLQSGADRAYFGEKDAQQLYLVRRLVEDFHVDCEIVACPTQREADGLAMSSRNVHLNPEDRVRSTALFQALSAARVLFQKGERRPQALEQAMQAVYRQAGLQAEYAAVVDDRTFQKPAGESSGNWRAVTAVRVGSTRLIDNLRLDAGD
ncbi:MAG: pantoate--beta-alanine ligase [Planctomycetota bacterium]|nr:MAG: pantoate--beta-alanine ligase [Planctomycetota bacterium]